MTAQLWETRRQRGNRHKVNMEYNWFVDFGLFVEPSKQTSFNTNQFKFNFLLVSSSTGISLESINDGI